jgi:hypothetical protein
MRDDTRVETAPAPEDPALHELRREHDRLRADAARRPALALEVERLRGELEAIERSVSWRATRPLRQARWLVDNRRRLALSAGRRLKRRLER